MYPASSGSIQVLTDVQQQSTNEVFFLFLSTEEEVVFFKKGKLIF